MSGICHGSYAPLGEYGTVPCSGILNRTGQLHTDGREIFECDCCGRQVVERDPAWGVEQARLWAKEQWATNTKCQTCGKALREPNPACNAAICHDQVKAESEPQTEVQPEEVLV